MPGPFESRRPQGRFGGQLFRRSAQKPNSKLLCSCMCKTSACLLSPAMPPISTGQARLAEPQPQASSAAAPVSAACQFAGAAKRRHSWQNERLSVNNVEPCRRLVTARYDEHQFEQRHSHQVGRCRYKCIKIARIQACQC